MDKIKLLGSTFARVRTGAALVGGVCLLVMMMLMVFEVVSRYVFNQPTGWAADIVAYGIAWVVFLAAAFTLAESGHINVDLVVSRLSKRKQIVVEIIASILALGYIIPFAWKGWELALLCIRQGYLANSKLANPLWPVYIIVPIGVTLLCLQFIPVFYKLFRDFKR